MNTEKANTLKIKIPFETNPHPKSPVSSAPDSPSQMKSLFQFDIHASKPFLTYIYIYKICGSVLFLDFS